MSKKFLGMILLVVSMFTFVLVGSIGVAAAEYTDTNHWAKNSIDYATSKGWFAGTSETTFSPNSEMTRGMFVSVLARFANADTANLSTASGFSDVSSAKYYASAVTWAYSEGIISGKSENSFHPEEVISREEAGTIFSRYVKELGLTLDVRNNYKAYADEGSFEGWSYDAIYEMQKYGIIVGDTNGKFNPDQGFKRSEATVVFCHLAGQFLDIYQVIPEKPVISQSYIGTFKSTFYCPGSCCNGGWSGQTALGVPPTPGRTIAVDPRLIPLGSYVTLEFSDARLQQYNGTYRAEDTGGAIKGNRLDVLLSSHSACSAAGVGSVKVYIQN